jgi:NADH dehydrogenase [ubiquinone] 1 alpha subcomplex assembly factor 6
MSARNLSRRIVIGPHRSIFQKQPRFLTLNTSTFAATSSSSSNTSSSDTRPSKQQQQQQQQRSPPPPPIDKKDFDYCVDLVQQRDRESYLCGLLMPYAARRAYFAIRAFNVELASIKDSSMTNRRTTNNTVGMTSTGSQQFFQEDSGANLALKVRMQWWRDALSQIYTTTTNNNNNHDDEQDHDTWKNNRPSSVDTEFFSSMASSYYKNPIVRVLVYSVNQKQLTRRFLERLVEGREQDLDRRQPETLQDMIDYADTVFASLLYLSLETVQVRDQQADIVAQHAGIGIGLVTALRGARLRLARGELSIPQELIPSEFPYPKLYSLHHDESNVDWDVHERQILQDAVQQVCVLASWHLSRAQELQSQIPPHARSCFLPVVPALHYLSKLEKARYDIFNDDILLRHQRGADHLTVLYLLSRTWLTGVF